MGFYKVPTCIYIVSKLLGVLNITHRIVSSKIILTNINQYIYIYMHHRLLIKTNVAVWQGRSNKMKAQMCKKQKRGVREVHWKK